MPATAETKHIIIKRYTGEVWDTMYPKVTTKDIITPSGTSIFNDSNMLKKDYIQMSANVYNGTGEPVSDTVVASALNDIMEVANGKTNCFTSVLLDHNGGKFIVFGNAVKSKGTSVSYSQDTCIEVTQDCTGLVFNLGLPYMYTLYSTTSNNVTTYKVDKTISLTTNDYAENTTILAHVGDVVLFTDLNYPDMWFTAVDSASESELSRLETTKVPIENYQLKVTALGSTTKPVYTSAAGTFAECSKYAGGTKVTLNGTNKGADDASFYAPTSQLAVTDDKVYLVGATANNSISTVKSNANVYMQSGGLYATTMYEGGSALSAKYQPLDADLTSIAGLTGTAGFLKKTAANTWALASTTSVTSTSGSEAVSIDGTSITVATRDTTQTISGTKTFSATTTTFKNIDTSTNNTYDLGTSSHKWKDFYIAGNLKDGTYSDNVAALVGKSKVFYDTTEPTKSSNPTLRSGDILFQYSS